MKLLLGSIVVVFVAILAGSGLLPASLHDWNKVCSEVRYGASAYCEPGQPCQIFLYGGLLIIGLLAFARFLLWWWLRPPAKPKQDAKTPEHTDPNTADVLQDAGATVAAAASTQQAPKEQTNAGTTDALQVRGPMAAATAQPTPDNPTEATAREAPNQSTDPGTTEEVKEAARHALENAMRGTDAQALYDAIAFAKKAGLFDTEAGARLELQLRKALDDDSVFPGEEGEEEEELENDEEEELDDVEYYYEEEEEEEAKSQEIEYEIEAEESEEEVSEEEVLEGDEELAPHEQEAAAAASSWERQQHTSATASSPSGARSSHEPAPYVEDDAS